MSANVIIRKQKISIRTADEATALRLRRQLNDSMQYELIALLEKVFAINNPSDKYVNLGKIKIDLGSLTEHDFAERFSSMAEPLLTKEMQRLLQDNNTIANTSATSDSAYYNSSDSSLPEVTIYSVRQQEINAVYYFLQKGIYPWWYKNEKQQTPAQLLESLSDEELKTLVLKLLSDKEVDNIDVVKRFAERLSIFLIPVKKESIIDSLLSLYHNPALSANVSVLQRNKEQVTGLFAISSKQFYTELFRALIFGHTEPGKNFITDFFEQLKKVKNISTEKLYKNSREVNLKTPDGREIQTALAKLAEQESKAMNEEEKKDGNKLQKKQAAVIEEGVYINNAGLVLLHPFLKNFFLELGLLEGNSEFVSLDAQNKAAVLLYYLQCGSRDYKEWEMLLNKVLCGIPAENVLPENISISNKEKEECGLLLQTVVGYWEALRGAGIEALQNTFILREGKIVWKDDFWLIQVERTGTDILIDRLPWGFSTVRLPWLDHIIYTEW